MAACNKNKYKEICQICNNSNQCRSTDVCRENRNYCQGIEYKQKVCKKSTDAIFSEENYICLDLTQENIYILLSSIEEAGFNLQFYYESKNGNNRITRDVHFNLPKKSQKDCIIRIYLSFTEKDIPKMQFQFYSMSGGTLFSKYIDWKVGRTYKVTYNCKPKKKPILGWVNYPCKNMKIKMFESSKSCCIPLKCETLESTQILPPFKCK